jgi:hypothetical protein
MFRTWAVSNATSITSLRAPELAARAVFKPGSEKKEGVMALALKSGL